MVIQRVARSQVMKTNRRKFIGSALVGGIGAAMPMSLRAGSMFKNKSSYCSNPNYDTLDEILKQPVLKRKLFPSPVIIETLELLQDRNNFICRVRSKEGAEGISIGSPNQGEYSYPMFLNRVQPFFKGKDARDLNLLVVRCEYSVKMQGIPLCVQIAAMEFAVLDFKLFVTKDANGNGVPIESKTEPFTSEDGVVKVPTGSSLGIVIDHD